MTGESNPEDQPVDSGAEEKGPEAEPQLLVEPTASDSANSDSPEANGASEERSDVPGNHSESALEDSSRSPNAGENGRHGNLEPTVKIKRPDQSSTIADDSEETTDLKVSQDESPGQDEKPKEDGHKRSRKKGPNQRRATPGTRGAERRQRGREAHSVIKHEALTSLVQSIQQLTNRTALLESNTQKIARALVEIVKEGDNRKRAYDILYDEMRQYKENFLWQCQKPLFMDLITLFDSILRVEHQYEVQEGMEKVVGHFRYLKDELLETLYRYDVEMIEEHPEKLDIGFQKPIKRVATDNPSEDRSVVKVVREGFAREGMILRPQEIVVKRYREAKEG
jgi:molecular chaperone GrpE